MRGNVSGDHRDIRRQYQSRTLSRGDLNADPTRQFSVWLTDVLELELKDATAMALATADAKGMPSVRIVLLKEHSDDGFVFYSDYSSQKGHDICANPSGELLFHWRELDRQVRIRGELARTPREDAEKYFASRPRASQISAIASAQSSPIDSRTSLETKVANAEAQDAIECPPDWGGYVLIPTYFEFWQGRADRLHDRFAYTLSDKVWQITRLQP